MAGQIKKMINSFISSKTSGKSDSLKKTIVNSIKVKFIFKGINPDLFNEQSPDDAAVISKLRQLIQELS